MRFIGIRRYISLVVSLYVLLRIGRDRPGVRAKDCRRNICPWSTSSARIDLYHRPMHYVSCAPRGKFEWVPLDFQKSGHKFIFTWSVRRLERVVIDFTVDLFAVLRG